jgi:hypothetical protein
MHVCYLPLTHPKTIHSFAPKHTIWGINKGNLTARNVVSQVGTHSRCVPLPGEVQHSSVEKLKREKGERRRHKLFELNLATGQSIRVEELG